MKAITTIFESMLGKDDSLVWTPADGGSTQAFADSNWEWRHMDASRNWEWRA